MKLNQNGPFKAAPTNSKGIYSTSQRFDQHCTTTQLGRGTRNIFQDFANVAMHSWPNKASQYSPGSRACLKVLEAFAFLTLKYAFSHFSGAFSSNYLMYICVGKLQNIYFNMKDSEHFGICNFPFYNLRQSRVLFVCRYISL